MAADASVCVLGGGPAGATVARRLAELGHAVVLVVRDGGPRHALGETFPVSALPLLASLGLTGAIDMATYGDERERLAFWGDREPVLQPGRAILLDRARFDRLLRAWAVDAGVCVMAAGASPRRDAPRGWLVPVAGRAPLRVPVLVDARGRRSGGGVRLGAPTVALVALWDRGPEETRIEAGEDFWAWGGPAPHGRHGAACFVDPARLAGIDSAGRSALYLALLARTRLFRHLGAGRLLGPPAVHEATSRILPRCAGPSHVVVGDAALATEPLSSQGVQAAIVSALQGAAAVNTLLRRPEDAALAQRFHRSCRLDAARRARRQAAAMHAAAWLRIGTPFWSARAPGALANAEEAERAPPAAAQAGAALRLAPALRIIDAPVLDGALIRRGRVVRHPGMDGPLAFLGGVAIAPLLAGSDFPAPEQALLRSWSKRIGPVEAARVLAWLRRSGLLIAA
jgi:flavin-dependent dehydrogenase